MVAGLAASQAQAQSPVQPPAQNNPDPYASKVHTNTYTTSEVNAPDPAGDFRGDSGSDLTGVLAEFDPVTGYAFVSYGTAATSPPFEVTTASRARFGYQQADGSCDATNGVSGAGRRT